MANPISRVVNLGVTPEQSPYEVRRVQTINAILIFAIFFNAIYVIAYLFIDPYELRLVITTNSLSILWVVLILGLNARGKTDAAMWNLFVASLFNLLFASLLLGLGTGVFLFLIIPGVTGVLVTRPNDLRAQMFFVGGSLIAFVVVVLVGPTTPEPIAGSPLETALLLTSVIGTVLFVATIALHFRRLADTAETELSLANQRSETLLLNILPEEIADRLKAGESVIADRVEEVTVLFADLVDSTPMSERLTPHQMVEVLNEIFSPFDDLADEMGLEKIKTIGDAYMVVGGLPSPRADHLEAVADLALGMRDEVGRHSVDGFGTLTMRYGIHTGPVIAGVIGKRKFSYDLWGDTVNTAARMESQGVPGEIQVTETVRQTLEDRYEFARRGPVDIKGKGMMDTYFLRARHARPAG